MLTRRRFLAVAAATAAVGAGIGIGACGSGGGPDRTRIRYGDHDDAFGDLWVPADAIGSLPVVVVVHGGFWTDDVGLDVMDDLAEALTESGYAAWNIEYRRVGGGGGYPATFDDVAAAVDHLSSIDDDRLDLERVGIVGHSAGGHLATWIAARSVLPGDAPWADPVVRPRVAVSQAGVLDLVDCAEQGLGGTACPDLLGGGPDDVPERYAVTSPTELVPIGVPVVAVHGDADGVVPVRQSQRYVDAAAAAGDDATVRIIEGANHFVHADPDSDAWAAALDALDTHLR